jgi:hypothetical protein
LTGCREIFIVLEMFRLLGGLVLVLGVSIGHAETENAKTLFERATVQFRVGQFHDAAMTYQRVYELHPDPVLLYNCAQSYRLANEPDKALLFYKSYLSAQPDAHNRAEVEGRIAELDRVVAEQKKATERPPNDVTRTPVPAPAEAQQPPAVATTPTAPVESSERPATGKKGRTKKIVGIALLGVAVGGAVGGIVAAVLSGQASDSINAAARGGQPFDPTKESAGTTDTIVSGVMFGVAGAAAVAGGVLLALGIRDDRVRENRVSVVPFLSPTVAGASVGVRF